VNYNADTVPLTAYPEDQLASLLKYGLPISEVLAILYARNIYGGVAFPGKQVSECIYEHVTSSSPSFADIMGANTHLDAHPEQQECKQQ